MATSQTNPLLAFGIVVGVAVIYFVVLALAAPGLRVFEPLPERVHVALVLPLVYVVPVAGAAFLQFRLTKEVPAATWWRPVQIAVAALLGPFVAASLVFAGWLAMGGKM